MVSTRGFLVASMTLMRFWCVFLLRVRRVGVVVGVPMVLFRLSVFQFLEDVLRLRTTRQKKAKRNRNGDGV
jgi:hypothetical protein